MSQQEFDNYIALLGRALKLNPAQRDAIADELRDHMEQRLAELTERGVDREHALTIALEEFGDATSLAGRFTEINHHSHRRQLMRYTLTTVTAACLIILVTMSILPERRDIPVGPDRAVAQGAPERGLAAPAPDAVAVAVRVVYDIRDLTAPDPGKGQKLERMTKDIHGLVTQLEKLIAEDGTFDDSDMAKLGASLQQMKQAITATGFDTTSADFGDDLTYQIMEMIQESIDPTGWASVGGEVSRMTQFRKHLVIATTKANHAAIATLLKQLREAKLVERQVAQNPHVTRNGRG